MIEEENNKFKELMKKVFGKFKTLKLWQQIVIIVIIISCIFGPFITNDTPTYTNTENSNTNNTEITQETEEERIAREEQEKQKKEQKEYEKAVKERQKRLDNNSAELYVATEQLVKNNLKSPSTAKFSNQKFGYNEEKSIYVISGSVDSQNSFGAMLRADFYAEYDQDLEIIYFTFDNQVIVNNR